MGAVTSLGHSVPELVEPLRSGMSPVQLWPERQELQFRSALAARVRDFPLPEIPRSSERSMGRMAQIALCAAREAVSDAGLSDADLQSPRTGIIVGNVGNYEEIFAACQRRSTGRPPSAFAAARTMGSSVSANLSVFFKTRGRTLTVAAACSSGSAAILYGCDLIRHGIQDRVIVGGSQEEGWELHGCFDSMRVFSARFDEPKKASRPFDRDRDGLVPSGGAGFLVLESLDGARSRGVRLHAEIAGWASNSDGFDMSIPSGVGSEECMRIALEHAGMDASEVDLVKAHATSTPVGDTVEARAIANVFPHHPYVTAPKSITGHELGASGATELIYSILMFQHGFISPTINLENIDDECRGINVVASPRDVDSLRVACCNSFGFGGVNVVLLVRKAA
jgi:3-oxoacyl-[acyl-carrier-protein] synthase-1